VASPSAVDAGPDVAAKLVGPELRSRSCPRVAHRHFSASSPRRTIPNATIESPTRARVRTIFLARRSRRMCSAAALRVGRALYFAVISTLLAYVLGGTAGLSAGVSRQLDGVLMAAST